MMLPWEALNCLRLNISLCSKVAESKYRWLAVEEAPSGTETAFWDHGFPITNVASFKYLGHLLMYMYNNWLTVVANLQKARKKWDWLSRTLVREGENACTPGNFFEVVVQAVLLFVLKSYVITPRVKKVLEGVHHRVARHLTGKKPCR